jgi:hypothetical protein
MDNPPHRYGDAVQAPAVRDPALWLRNLGSDAAADLMRIISASGSSARGNAVNVAREHGRGWGDIAIAVALSRRAYTGALPARNPVL